MKELGQTKSKIKSKVKELSSDGSDILGQWAAQYPNNNNDGVNKKLWIT